MPPTLLTTRQAADQLNVSDRRVRAMIGSGRLKSTRVGQIHLIDARDLKAVRQRKAGRPRSKPAKKRRAK